MFELTTGNKIIILFIMLWLHIFDDYCLQDKLAKLKQRAWWKLNAPESKYKHDYIIALVEHSFSWTVTMMFPVFVCCLLEKSESKIEILTICLLVVFNTFLHALIDDLKANKQSINLVKDQISHILQVAYTWFICFSLVWG